MNIQPIEVEKSLVSKSLSSAVTISEKVSPNIPGIATPDVPDNIAYDKNKDNAQRNSDFTKYLVDKIQENIDQIGINLEFSTYGEDNERIAIIVKEKVTGKLIREIPPENVQKLYEKMNELTGILFNKEV